LMAGAWRLEVGGRLEVENRSLEVGWRLEVEGWRLEVVYPESRGSLQGTLAETKRAIVRDVSYNMCIYICIYIYWIALARPVTEPRHACARRKTPAPPPRDVPRE
jgi:hypothetical protein